MINKSVDGNQKITLENYKLFLTILLFIPLYLFENIYIKMTGSILIIIILLLTNFNFLYKEGYVKFNQIHLWFLIYIFYNAFMLARTPTIKALYSYLLQVALLFFVTTFTTISLEKQAMSEIFKWGKLLCSILLIPACIIALEGGREAFGQFNDYFSPVIYKIILPCTFFFIANSRYKLLKVLLFSFIYLRMVERTASIVLIIIYVVYLILKRIRSSKTLYKFTFVATFVGIIIFVYGYVHLQQTEVGYMINDIFRKYTGGNFYSGRDDIWETAYKYINKSSILGYGIDNGLLHTAGIELSAHNTYIHILLQGGIIGLSIFFMFIFSIWKRYFIYLENDIVAVAAAYLIGILVFINFEVTLIGNSTVIAIFLWFVLGIGLIECNNSEKQIEKSNYKDANSESQ